MRRFAFPGARKGFLMAVIPTALLNRFFALVMPRAVFRLGLRYRIDPSNLFCEIREVQVHAASLVMWRGRRCLTRRYRAILYPLYTMRHTSPAASWIRLTVSTCVSR